MRGLASNLAALRALATDGIQRGDMALHARGLARAAGPTADLGNRVAAKLVATGDVKADRARDVTVRIAAGISSTGPEARAAIQGARHDGS